MHCYFWLLSKIKDCLKFHETLHLFAFSAPERPCGFPTRLNVSHSSLLHLIISFSLHLSSQTNLLQSEEITYLFRENLKINNGESEWSIIIINLVVYAFYNVHKGKSSWKQNCSWMQKFFQRQKCSWRKNAQNFYQWLGLLMRSLNR